ncbi:unnamed protein product [Ixodes hexagonus]
MESMVVGGANSPEKLLPKTMGIVGFTLPLHLLLNYALMSHFFGTATKPEQIGESKLWTEGQNVLTLLTYFSFCSGFVVYYMHAVCRGFVKATTLMWLKSKKCQSFRLRHHLEEVDKMLSMRPVWEMSRLPRLLKDAKYWKSAEWRNWLLLYSPVVLSGYIPSKHYKHWTSFVDIMHYLLSTSIAFEELNRIKIDMVNFLREYDELMAKRT